MSFDYECWFDGCCEPKNPGGHASYGALIQKYGQTVFSEGEYVCGGPEASNNVAENAGAMAVIKWLDQNAGESALKIIIRGDSKLVINQLSGRWNTNCTKCGKAIKKCLCGKPTPGLYYPFYVQAKELFGKLSRRHKVTLTWIPREQNDICDVLSKGVLKGRGVEFKIQPKA